MMRNGNIRILKRSDQEYLPPTSVAEKLPGDQQSESLVVQTTSIKFTDADFFETRNKTQQKKAHHPEQLTIYDIMVQKNNSTAKKKILKPKSEKCKQNDKARFEKKGIIRLTPKKKTISSLKKQLLKERAEIWHRLQAEMEPNRCLTEAHYEDDLDQRKFLKISGIITDEEPVDDDEFQEIISDISAMMRIYGDITNITFPRNKCEKGYGNIYVEFISSEDAATARSFVDRKIVGGSQICVTSHMTLDSAFNCTKRENDPSILLEESKNFLISEERDHEKELLIISDYVAVQELLDDEEKTEIVENILTLAGACGRVKKILFLSSQKDCTVDICLEFFNEHVIDAAASKFDGITVGGARIKASKVKRSFITGESSNGSLEVVFDGSTDAIKYSDCGEIDIYVDSATEDAAKYDDNVEKLETLTHSLTDEQRKKISQKSAQVSSHWESHGQKLTRIPNQYRDAVQVPNVIPILLESCRLLPKDTSNIELNEALSKLIKKLFFLQEKQKANPSKNKILKRVSVGMHETFRGVRSGRVKLVVFASDIDTLTVDGLENALGARVNEIRTAALNKNILVINAFSKRKLGKLLEKSTKISAVGIYSYDGAREENNRVQMLLKRHNLESDAQSLMTST